jgi:AraC-like DNA-binding protein
MSVRVETDDPSLAAALVNRASAGRLRIVSPRRPFRLRHSSTGDSDVTLQSTAVTGLLTGTIDNGEEYVVLWLTAGEGAVQIGGDELLLAVGRPVVLPPGITPLHLDDARVNHVHVRAAFLDDLGAELGLGGTAPWGDAAGAVPGPLFAGWTDAVRHAAADLLGPVPTSAERHDRNRVLAAAALAAFPRWEVGPDRHHRSSSPRVRAAMAYIRQHAQRRLGTDDIAAAVGLSQRGLQLAFQRELATTPQAFLQDVRLAEVRRDLLAATPDRMTVRSAATRWGFRHLGRFAEAYRNRFGELPRESLHR